MARAATGLITSGAAGGATSRMTENELEHKPLGQGVVESAAIGAAANVVGGGIMKYGVGPIVLHSFPRLAPVLGLGEAPKPAPAPSSAAAAAAPAAAAPAAAAPAAVPPPPVGPPHEGMLHAFGAP
jgi:hypothetical protein